MNADTARGNAVGFGVEVLAQLMGVKSADQETTLMHYLVELTAARGVPAAVQRPDRQARSDAEGGAVYSARSCAPPCASRACECVCCEVTRSFGFSPPFLNTS